jgi:undecaprenyl-diphosphatase
VDYQLAQSFDHFSARHDGFEDVLTALMPGAEIFFALVLVGLFLAVPRPWRPVAQRAAIAAGASLVVAVLAAHFLGIAVDRARPFVDHPGTIHAFLAHAADTSFPSDHATAAFAIATAVLLWWRPVGLVLLVLAGLVSVGRVFLGLHYPTDVLAGAALGATVAAVMHLEPMRGLVVRVADTTAGAMDRTVRRVRSGAA